MIGNAILFFLMILLCSCTNEVTLDEKELNNSSSLSEQNMSMDALNQLAIKISPFEMPKHKPIVSTTEKLKLLLSRQGRVQKQRMDLQSRLIDIPLPPEFHPVERESIFEIPAKKYITVDYDKKKGPTYYHNQSQISLTEISRVVAKNPDFGVHLIFHEETPNAVYFNVKNQLKSAGGAWIRYISTFPSEFLVTFPNNPLGKRELSFIPINKLIANQEIQGNSMSIRIHGTSIVAQPKGIPFLTADRCFFQSNALKDLKLPALNEYIIKSGTPPSVEIHCEPGINWRLPLAVINLFLQFEIRNIRVHRVNI